ncbi:MAG: SMC-Scp complex subunit ScpB [Candidatus Woesearchaeota archaeon]|nr:MAG: SMC-Scp complex subunit ScpB [Candidatus Woesearchaeota archaeon]
MEEVKNKIEAILYCIPEGVSTRKLASMLGIGSVGYVKKALESLQEEYKQANRGFQIVEEATVWRFIVKQEYLDLVKEAAKPELPSSVLETLAYIAKEGKIKQSELIKKRTNKAYDHIKELKNVGFVEVNKKGRTNVLSLTKKFYDYFQLQEGEKLNLE